MKHFLTGEMKKTQEVSNIIPPIPIPLLEIDNSVLSRELAINEALPGLVRGEHTALLLDVNNLYHLALDNKFRIDYGKLKSLFENRCELRYCAAFSAINNNDPDSINWAEFMAGKGYKLITKNIKRYTDSKTGRLVTKGNMDVDITLAAKNLSEGFAHVIIGTCDGDFIPLIDDLKIGGLRKVSIMGIRNDMGIGIDENLIREADHFYNLLDIVDHISLVRKKDHDQ